MENDRPTKMKQIANSLRETVPIRKEQKKARADRDAPPIQSRYRGVLALANSSLHFSSGTLYGYFAFAHLTFSIR